MRVVFSVLAVAAALRLHENAQEGANPIRRVVNILQATQKKIIEEGHTETDLFEKFQCYCKNGAGKLAAEIAESERTMGSSDSESKEQAAAAARLDSEIKEAKKGRQEAKDRITEAQAVRKKEKAEFDKLASALSGQAKQLDGAIEAISKGMGQSFLQNKATASSLQKIIIASDLNDSDRESVAAFLQNPFGDYAAQSGEIQGILKTLLDESNKDYADAKEAEKKAVSDFKELIAEQTKVINAMTKAIQEKSLRKGEAAVAAVEAANAGKAANAQLAADKEFLVNMDKNCKDKEAKFQEREADRARELKGINEAIRILNNDEALDLFKKTLATPGLAPAGAVLLQADTVQTQRIKAFSVLKSVGAISGNPSRISLIAYMLRSGKVSFEKVMGMIDKMIGTLQQEQKDDDSQLKYCSSELEKSSDTKKELNRNIKGEEATIDNLTEEIATLKDDMATLKGEMEDAAKSAAEATDLRKKENAEFQESQSDLNAAMQLVKKAANVIACTMGAPTCTTTAGPQLSADERIAANLGEEIATAAPTMIKGTNIVAFLQKSRDVSLVEEKPADAPETWEGDRKDNTSTLNGVTSLMENLNNQLKAEFEAAEFEEKTAQEDYEKMMADNKKQAQANAAAMTEKENQKAEAETSLADTKNQNADSEDALAAEEKRIAALHGECDFLIENFDYRKSARAKEEEGMKQAKAVLAGAGFA